MIRNESRICYHETLLKKPWWSFKNTIISIYFFSSNTELCPVYVKHVEWMPSPEWYKDGNPALIISLSPTLLKYTHVTQSYASYSFMARWTAEPDAGRGRPSNQNAERKTQQLWPLGLGRGSDIVRDPLMCKSITDITPRWFDRWNIRHRESDRDNPVNNTVWHCEVVIIGHHRH